MFIPIGDSPNLAKTPWVTWALIAVNVAVYLALLPLSFAPPSPGDPTLEAYARVLIAERGASPQRIRITQGDLVRFRYGVKPRYFSLRDAFTSMFLHGGLVHLLGNMLFLWIFGDNVEHRLGKSLFLLAYLGTGFAAALGDSLLRLDSGIPSVGASGAISGVLGLYFAWFPHNRVRVWVFLFPFLMDVVELPARLVLGIFLVVQNLLPLLLTGGEGGVSHGAHIGGFFAGWALAWAAGEAARGAPRPRRLERAVRPPPESLSDAFARALSHGRIDEAASLLFDLPRHLTRTSLHAEEKVNLGEALEEAGEIRAALGAYQRALADHPRGPHRSHAHLGAARTLMRGVGTATAAYQHLYAALEEGPTPEDAQQARTLLAELQKSARVLPRKLPR